jgi:hypothetical protein
MLCPFAEAFTVNDPPPLLTHPVGAPPTVSVVNESKYAPESL